MKYSETIERLNAGGPDGWALYREARQMMDDGHDIIGMAIGEPDVATPDSIVDATIDALRAGRTEYAESAGEPNLRRALATRYSDRTGRTITADQVVCLPGTQTALYVAMRAIAGAGDQVLVGDPMYATYDSVIASTGADRVGVPLRPDRGFRLDADDLEAAVTDRSVAVLLNTPHNPTGAILEPSDIDAIGRVAREHDLWIVADEVYEEMVLDPTAFTSPLAFEDLAERTIVLNSISKSHASPGLRSGWCIAPPGFADRILPLADTVLFGNQPFIADATAAAVAAPSTVARGMAERFAARARRLAESIHAASNLTVHVPEAGMFALIDVSSTGMDSAAYARDLLVNGGVIVMPGTSFGDTLRAWVRVALTADDADFDEGTRRMIAHAAAHCDG